MSFLYISWRSQAADVPLSIDHYRYFAGWADKIHGKVCEDVVYRMILTACVIRKAFSNGSPRYSFRPFLWMAITSATPFMSPLVWWGKSFHGISQCSCKHGS